MGISTNAILFYGYCWSYEVKLLPQGHGKWPEMILLKRGHKDPWIDFPTSEIKALEKNGAHAQADVRRKQWREANSEALDAWIKLKGDVEKEFGCEIYTHCSESCQMPYVAVCNAGCKASRGYPVEITTDILIVGQDWNARLTKFCSELEITPPQDKPQWWLASFIG